MQKIDVLLYTCRIDGFFQGRLVLAAPFQKVYYMCVCILCWCCVLSKGRLISECLFDVLTFPKNQRKNLMNSCPRSLKVVKPDN